MLEKSTAPAVNGFHGFKPPVGSQAHDLRPTVREYEDLVLKSMNMSELATQKFEAILDKIVWKDLSKEKPPRDGSIIEALWCDHPDHYPAMAVMMMIFFEPTSKRWLQTASRKSVESLPNFWRLPTAAPQMVKRPRPVRHSGGPSAAVADIPADKGLEVD